MINPHSRSDWTEYQKTFSKTTLKNLFSVLENTIGSHILSQLYIVVVPFCMAAITKHQNHYQKSQKLDTMALPFEPRGLQQKPNTSVSGRSSILNMLSAMLDGSHYAKITTMAQLYTETVTLQSFYQYSTWTNMLLANQLKWMQSHYQKSQNGQCWTLFVQDRDLQQRPDATKLCDQYLTWTWLSAIFPPDSSLPKIY